MGAKEHPMFDFLSFTSPAPLVKTLAEPNPVHFLISFAETPTSLTFAKADSKGDTIARYDQTNIIHKKNTASQVPENSGSIDSTGVLAPCKTLYSI